MNITSQHNRHMYLSFHEAFLLNTNLKDSTNVITNKADLLTRLYELEKNTTDNYLKLLIQNLTNKIIELSAAEFDALRKDAAENKIQYLANYKLPEFTEES